MTTAEKVGLAMISIHAPLTGRDTTVNNVCPRQKYFNPRAPHGARPKHVIRITKFADISIHAPLTGRDARRWGDAQHHTISIHAPLTGRDGHHPPRCGLRPDISIHAPLTGRDAHCRILRVRVCRFQSTRPSRGATGGGGGRGRTQKISIHAPLTGRDILHAIHGILARMISIHAPLTGRDTMGRSVMHT